MLYFLILILPAPPLVTPDPAPQFPSIDMLNMLSCSLGSCRSSNKIGRVVLIAYLFLFLLICLLGL